MSGDKSMDRLLEELRVMQEQAESLSTLEELKEKRLTINARHLSYLLDLLEIANNQLAKNLNVDDSLVSRWRGGTRSLNSKNPLFYALVDYLAMRLEPLPDTEALLKPLQGHGSTNASETQNPTEQAKAEGSSDHSFESLLASWLTRHEPVEEQMTVAIAEFLDSTIRLSQVPQLTNSADMSTLRERVRHNPYLSAYFEQELHPHKQPIYHGVQGLCEASIRFLMEAIQSAESCHLKLYSNQNIDWMTEDKDFFAAWGFLMKLLLQRGHTVTIIHSLDRSPLEMLTGLRSWLPVYTQGKIEPYCLNNRTSELVLPPVKTLFINSGRAAIHSDAFVGMEDRALVFYTEKNSDLTALEAQFELLKEQSIRLGYFYRGKDARELLSSQHEAAYFERFTDANFRIFNSSLPIDILPVEARQLVFSQYGSAIRDFSAGVWEGKLAGRQEDLDAFLSRGNHLQLAIPGRCDGEHFLLDLFPLSDQQLALPAELFPSLFHSVRAWAEDQLYVDLCPLKEVPFTPLNLSLVEDEYVQVMFRNSQEQLLVQVEHPVFLTAFSQYLDTLIH